MLADEAEEARAAATDLMVQRDAIDSFAHDLAEDVRALVKENEALRRVIKTLAKLA